MLLRTKRTLWGGLALALASVAAANGRPAVWADGTPAAGTAAATAPDGVGPVVLLPKAVAKQVRKQALLFYFAPDCSHCRDVAPEVVALAESLGKDTRLVPVATARSTSDQVREYAETFGIDEDVFVDADAEVGAALGLKGTPAMVLLGKRSAEVVELARWAPYAPRTDRLVRMRISGDPWSELAAATGYLGNATCAVCHTQETRSWQLSHHSVAWRTLVLSGGSRDPECTDCHVTGAHQPGGWQGVEDKAMVDVGCEACHGPAGPHDGVPTEATSTCASCHDAKHSIAFDVDKGLPHIDHYAANALDDAAFGEARKALLGGEAPKPLLAFGDGPYVGSAACASCHEPSHAWWQGSGHGRAMATLVETEQHTDLECVRCHATPMVGGPAPTTLAGYRAEEGVGCESCHGPGGEHVAAEGGVDNIVGLGGSCPVCVIEAICTSCHTPKWDEDWDLQADLARISHPEGE